MQGMPVQLPESFSQNPTGAEIGLWPLAWGWWVILVAVAVSITLLTIWYRSYRKKRRILRQASKALSLLDRNAVDYIAQCNHIIKRAFLSYFPEHTVASLHGEGWQQFLRNNLSNRHQLTLAPLIEQLGVGMYQPAPSQSVSAETAKQALTLLKATLPPAKKQLLAAEDTPND